MMQDPLRRAGLFALLLAGCGGGSGNAAVPPITTLPTTSVTSVSQVSGAFIATLTQSAATESVNGSITYSLSVQNTSSTSATLLTATDNGQNAPIASLSVRNAAGQTVYPVVLPLGSSRAPLAGPPAPPTGDGTSLAAAQALTLPALFVTIKQGVV